jgi:hypothetical protein
MLYFSFAPEALFYEIEDVGKKLRFAGKNPLRKKDTLLSSLYFLPTELKKG